MGNLRTTRILNNVLRLAALGTLTSTALLAPNAIQIFDKPIQKLLKELDEKERKVELQQLLRYARSRRLITEDYQHGIQLTQKALARVQQADFTELQLPISPFWDGKWRIIFFDIPESMKSQRDAFAAKIRHMGFEVLQRSVFIYPHECRKQVAIACEHYKVRKYVSYIESTYLENEKALLKKFDLE